MTIAFRHFPYLVQQQVLDQIDLFDIFSIYSISKKGRALARSYFSGNKFELRYIVGQEQFWIHRTPSSKHYCYHSDHVYIVVRNGFEVFKNPSFFTQYGNSFTTSSNYSEDTNESRQKMLNFVRESFPRLQLYLKFSYLNLAGFLDTMNFVRCFNAPIKRVDAGVRIRANTELVRAVMTQCSDVKELQILCSRYSPFQYDFRTHAPFKFDFFELQCSTWGTKDQLTLFLSCKKVIVTAVQGLHYTDQELTEFCKKWLEAPEMQHLQIEKVRTALEGIGKLPGAVPVQEVTVGDRKLKFGNGKKCFMMKKANGTHAIVYQDVVERIFFRTDFQNAVIDEDL
ncbi:hypothetical protein CAEBREN_16623 [Caenorhabditis brenneri]|uniref:F-box domain-containing protein n=1 Tax=Caenorhabditis brenneri TaxID=135651 RepID=G0NCT1_CAEBE|nr:hypothetical protein CAEBREN_16623 [Caenorhabditis brenneri]